MIRKAVIPVAGIAARLLPLTKAMPKEMLPIVDRPMLQVIVDELVDSGITDIIIVTNGRKQLIESHFAPDPDLERTLQDLGKFEIAQSIAEVSSKATISYIHQQGQYGNGTPVLNAARIIGNEPFLVLWGDDFFVSAIPRARQLIGAYEKYGVPVVALTYMDEPSAYGVATVSQRIDEDLFRVDGIVEKPTPGNELSKFACVGGYVVTPSIVEILANLSPDETGEIYLSRALDIYSSKQMMLGKVIKGTWHDTGTLSSYARAFVYTALYDNRTRDAVLQVFIEEFAENQK